MAQRTYALPETFNDISVRDLHCYDEQFHNHLTQLAKEAFCLKVVQLFQACPALSAIQLWVDSDIQESTYRPDWSEVRYVLDLACAYSVADTDATDLPEIDAALRKELEVDCFSQHLARFCDGLRIRRSDVLDVSGACRAHSSVDLARIVEQLKAP